MLSDTHPQTSMANSKCLVTVQHCIVRLLLPCQQAVTAMLTGLMKVIYCICIYMKDPGCHADYPRFAAGDRPSLQTGPAAFLMRDTQLKIPVGALASQDEVVHHDFMNRPHMT